MIKIEKLKQKISENGLTISLISEKLHINKSTFYRKMYNNSFILYELCEIKNILNLSAIEADEIFFAEQGA